MTGPRFAQTLPHFPSTSGSMDPTVPRCSTLQRASGTLSGQLCTTTGTGPGPLIPGDLALSLLPVPFLVFLRFSEPSLVCRWDEVGAMTNSGYPTEFLPGEPGRKYDGGGRPSPLLLPMMCEGARLVSSFGVAKIMSYCAPLTERIAGWAIPRIPVQSYQQSAFWPLAHHILDLFTKGCPFRTPCRIPPAACKNNYAIGSAAESRVGQIARGILGCGCHRVGLLTFWASECLMGGNCLNEGQTLLG